MKIVSAADYDGDRLGADNHPITGRFGRGYFPLVFGPEFADHSFAVVDGAKTVAFIPVTLSQGGADWFGLPIRISWRNENENPEIASLIVKQIQGLSGNRVRLLDQSPNSEFSPIGAACSAAGLKPVEAMKAISDLSLTPDERKSAMRRRYRGHVNWGRKNMTLEYVNAVNPDRGAFEKYKALHLKTAGKSTRSQASWDAMFDWIARGGGELSVGYLDGELVAGTMTVDGDEWSYYASGVYDRDRFDKPISHLPMADAIERSAERGKRFFEIGEVPTEGTASEKEVNIGKFKAGFATSIIAPTIWQKQ